MYNSMNYIGKFISNFRDFYNEINAATLTGAIDVVVVQQPDGSYTCSPFHVRFGKLGVLRSREKVVDIEINSEPRQIHMKLGDSGEAFFVEEVPGSDGSPSDSEIPPHLACSPIPNDDECFGNRRFNVLSELPQEQHEKILRDSVMSIEREKWEQMSALPPDQRERFLVEHFSDLPLDQREKWLQIASLTTEERDKIFQEYYGSISTLQKQRMISEQYSALKTEDKERLFKENFPELPAEQRQSFEKALLSDWHKNNASPPKKSMEITEDDEEEAEEEEEDDDDKDKSLRYNDDEEIFDMEGVTDEKPKTPVVSNPKSFVAFTSTDRIRKISVVNNEFRPINENDSSDQFDSKDRTADELIPASHKSLSSSSSSSSTKRSSKDESTADEIKSNTNSSKRKRKRKSTMKRKGMQRKISATNNAETTSANNSNQAKTADVIPVVEIEKSHKDDTESKVIPKDESKNIPEQDQLNKIKVTHVSTDFHFFSDTEITAKNKESRPSSPVQSDTEFEVQKITQESKVQEDKGQSWRWGELPSPPHDASLDAHGRPLNPADATATNNEIEKTADEEDAESGNGPSLPQSPNSVEGAIGGPKSLDSDFDESSSKNFEPSLEVSLSLCGNLDSTTDAEPSDELFQRHAVRFEDVCSDAKLFENPNLVVKVNGKYYTWAAACAVVMTYTTFQKHLPHSTLTNLYEDRKRSASDSKVDRSNSRGSSGYSSWFSWRRSSQPAKKSSNHDNSVISPTEMNQSEAVVSKDDGTDSYKTTIVINDESNKDTLNDQMTTSLDSMETSQSVVSFTDAVDDSKSELQTCLTNKDADREGYSAGNEEDDSEEEHQLRESSGIDIPSANNSSNNLSAVSAATDIPKREGTPNYRKTLRLSSEQIASLNLKEGTNECVFSVTTAYQGTTRCKCSIYKWRWDDKIVISDIDGTITKSDVLGHILPIVGKDWAQSGVAQLFTKIKNNGYKLLYLSARAIGQARVTREYLRSIRQDDLSLPDGPLMLNPTSLISAFHREVIEKKPEQFKISCLSDIKALFPEGSQPFYAGYGNRINDVWAYRAVGIPTTRIFTINHRGELKHELTQTFQSTYSNMSYIVDHVFPAIREDVADEFSNFSYWREPIPDLVQQEMLSM